LNRTQVLSNFIFDSSIEDFTAEIIEASKKCLLDWIGVTLSGARDPSVRILIDLIEEMGGRRQATILGYGMKTNVLNAAFVNGTASHILDYDDAHEGTRSHPSAPLIPALLAISEYKNLSGSEFITAFVLGFEVSTRIGLTLGKSYYDLGWHATPILGRFGAAAGVGKLLKLNRDRLAIAFGLAATNVGGLRRVFGTMGKSFHAGKAAMDGMLSALLSQKGFTSPMDILDGEPSFFEMFFGEHDPNGMIRGLGKDYQILKSSFKLYAACLLTHPAIDGLIWMRREFDFHSGSVEQIDLEVCPPCLAVTNNTNPKNALEGKFSIYFCAALAVEKGEVKESHFTQSLVDDDRIRGLMKKINVIRNESLGESEAHIRVKLKNGIERFHHVVAPKGDPRNPLSFEEIIKKFEDLNCTLLSRRRMNRMIDIIQNLEKLQNLSELIRLCCVDRDLLRRVKT